MQRQPVRASVPGVAARRCHREYPRKNGRLKKRRVFKECEWVAVKLARSNGPWKYCFTLRHSGRDKPRAIYRPYGKYGVKPVVGQCLTRHSASGRTPRNCAVRRRAEGGRGGEKGAKK